MNTTNPAFLAFLEEQRADYRRSLPQRLVQIESLWRQVLSGEAPAEALASLERCAHSLAGSGATFAVAGRGQGARGRDPAIGALEGAEPVVPPAALNEAGRAVKPVQG